MKHFLELQRIYVHIIFNINHLFLRKNYGKYNIFINIDAWLNCISNGIFGLKIGMAFINTTWFYILRLLRNNKIDSQRNIENVEWLYNSFKKIRLSTLISRTYWTIKIK